MPKFSNVVFVLFVFLFLGGCASGPTFSEHQSTVEPLSDGDGRIYIYRTTAFGAALTPDVKVNDEVVGKAVAKGFIIVDRPQGNYSVSSSTEAKRSLSLRLAEGEEKYVRLDVKMGLLVGHVKPVLVEPELGREQILDTKLITQ